MTIAFLGGEMSAFLPSDSIPTELTSGGIYVFPYDSNFARCGMQTIGLSYFDTPQFAALTECWTHIHMAHFGYGNNNNHYPIVWLNASDVESLRLKHDCGFGGTETLSFERWNGAAWVAAGTAVNVPFGNMQVLDIRLVVNSASGVVALYVAGTERINATVDLSLIASIRKMRITAGTSNGFSSETRFSQVVIASDSTIGYRLATFYMTGAGATSSWTGTYTDIDETIYSDADFINSATNNQISTFTHTGPVMTGYTVRAVGVTARAKRGASGPQNIRMALRVSGTDYFSAADIALGLGYTPVQTIWETNPATAAAWVNTAIATLQPGVKSLA